MDFLPFEPVVLDRCILGILNKLVNDVVDLKTDALRFVTYNDTFGRVEIADEAVLISTKFWLTMNILCKFDTSCWTYLFKQQVLIQAGFTISVSAESSHTLLDNFEAKWANKLLERIFLRLETCSKVTCNILSCRSELFLPLVHILSP